MILLTQYVPCMFSCAAFLDVAIGITHDAIGIMHDAIGITHDAIGITYDAITDDVLKSRSSDSLFQLPTCVRMHVHNLVRPGQPIQECCCRFYPMQYQSPSTLASDAATFVVVHRCRPVGLRVCRFVGSCLKYFVLETYFHV